MRLEWVFVMCLMLLEKRSCCECLFYEAGGW